MTFHHMRAPRPAEVQPATVQVGPVTEALRAVRKAMTTPVRVGPVTEAIRTMRAAVPDFDRDEDVLSLRRALSRRIEADLAVLDALDGDTDAEPSLGSPELPASQYRLTGPDGRPYRPGDQSRWAAGVTDDREQDAGDEPEEENEHGGAVDDQGEDSLGSLCGTADGIDMPQTKWTHGIGFDREDEHDGREDDELEDDRSVSRAEFEEIDRRMMEGVR